MLIKKRYYARVKDTYSCGQTHYIYDKFEAKVHETCRTAYLAQRLADHYNAQFFAAVRWAVLDPKQTDWIDLAERLADDLSEL